MSTIGRDLILAFAERKFDKAVAEFKLSNGDTFKWAQLNTAMMRYQQVFNILQAHGGVSTERIEECIDTMLLSLAGAESRFKNWDDYTAFWLSRGGAE